MKKTTIMCTFILVHAAIFISACQNHRNANTYIANDDVLRNKEFIIDSLFQLLNPKMVYASDTCYGVDAGYAIIENDTFRKTLIDEKLKIYSFSHVGFVEKPLMHQRDFLTISDQKILFDSLLFESVLPDDYALMTSFIYALQFEFNSNKFKCIFFGNARENTTRPMAFFILLDVTDNCHIVFSDYQVSEDLSCFGDIDSNGSLDFIRWEYGRSALDTITLYQLNSENSKFELRHEYYVIVEEADQIGCYFIKTGKWPIVSSIMD